MKSMFRFILGALLAAGFSSHALAQTQESRSALEAYINSTIYNQTAGAVSPAILNSILNNQVASYASLSDVSNPFSYPPTFLGQSGACVANGSSPISCGILPFTYGGTGQSTRAGAQVAIFPSATQVGQVPTWNGSSWGAATPSNANSPLAYGAAFSVQNTTGTVSASSASLTLANAKDFANGNGIRINHAGASFALPAPTSLTITPTGTTGATAYQYTIASLDLSGGVGATITPVSTATGNATLSQTNYNALSWTAAAGVGYYLVCGNKSGSLVPIAIVNTNSYQDMGVEAWGPPDFLPATCPIASSLADWLVTSVSAGGGTTALTLAASATNTATSQYVIHDDTVADQAWLSAAVSQHFPAVAPCGDSPISSTLTASTSLTMYGCGYQADSNHVSTGLPAPIPIPGWGEMTLAELTGSGTVFVATPNINGMIFTGNDPVNLRDFEVLYPVGRQNAWNGSAAWPGTVGLTVQSTGGYLGSTNLNSESALTNITIYGADTGITMTNTSNFTIINPNLMMGWNYGININGYNYPGYGDSVILGGQIGGCCNNTTLVPQGYQAGILNQSGAGLKIEGVKFNWGNGASTSWIFENPYSYFNASQTGNTHTSTTIDNIGSTSGWLVGMSVTCSDCQSGTTIATIPGSTSITLNKATTGTHTAQALTVTLAGGLEPIVIDGNSIEGGANCVAMTLPDTGALIGLITIANNEMWCGNYALYVAGSSAFVFGMNVTGNMMQINNINTTTVAAIDAVTSGAITGNYLGCYQGCSSTTGFSLGSHTSNLNVQSNSYASGITTKVNNAGSGNTIGGGSS